MLLPRPIIYITRDFERAQGIPLSTEGYFVITNACAATKELGPLPNLIALETGVHFDTHELLEREETEAILETYTDAGIVVFKNSSRIERICKANKWNLLNPSATLASAVEPKIAQIAWLGELTALLPAHQIKSCDALDDTDIGRILQFNFGHTGTSTVFLESEATINHLRNTFPKREARVSDFVEGSMYTLNAVVSSESVITSTISYQITGIKPFTDNPYASIGNDWVFPKKVLKKDTAARVHTVASLIGEKLRADGWRGLFGIDVLIEKGTDQVYLIEINARQPASVSYESSLQSLRPTTMEAHLLALLDEPVARIASVLTGAQIFDRRGEHPIVHHFDTGVMASHGVLDNKIVRGLK